MNILCQRIYGVENFSRLKISTREDIFCPCISRLGNVHQPDRLPITINDIKLEFRETAASKEKQYFKYVFVFPKPAFAGATFNSKVLTQNF